jgi:periplasmic protein TonB
MRIRILGITAAVVFHGALLLFGGLLFGIKPEDGATTVRNVDLLAEDLVAEPEEKEVAPEPAAEPAPTEESEPLEVPEEKPPDTQTLLESVAAEAAPALEALSLSALESALNGGATSGAAGDFATSAPLESGGRIGGRGVAGAEDGAGGGGALDEIFNLAELDQKPQPLFQAPPAYPVEMRQRKAQGQVTVLFVVDAMGRVQLPKIEASSHPAFEKPALDAIRQWRFEPGVRGGHKVQSRMRVPIRFAFS